MVRDPDYFTDLHWAVEIWPDIILESPTLGAHSPSEGDGWMMPDISVKAYYTHEANTLSIKEKEHQAVRSRYLDILKD